MDRTDALLNAIANQRNNAANDSANLAADLQMAQARIAELEREAAELRARLEVKPIEGE